MEPFWIFLLVVFRCLGECYFSVEHWKCFVDYETDFTSARGWVDNAWLFISGWTYPLMWIHDTEWYVVTLSFGSTPNLNGFFSPYDRAGGLSANLLKKKKRKKKRQTERHWTETKTSRVDKGIKRRRTGACNLWWVWSSVGSGDG